MKISDKIKIMISQLKTLFVASLLGINVTVSAQAPFSLPKLNYGYDAFEASIDKSTMEIHHSKHHNAYVTNLNKSISGTKMEMLTLEQLLLNATKRPDAVRNNAGGHYNHTLFWEILTPKTNTQPSTELTTEIIKHFGSMDSLKKAMNAAAGSRFGSGWAWLVLTSDNRLVVTSTANQDNPLMDVFANKLDRGIPILGIDVWEHAYYLKYQNKRGDYLGAIWNIVNWVEVSNKLEAARQNPTLKLIGLQAWTELTTFHGVMGQTFHPAEENNLIPIRNRSAELVEKAKALQAAKIPTQFDTPQIKDAIARLVKGAEELNTMNKKRTKDEVLKTKLTALHDVFHEIQGLCVH
jgi:superoxide dismutase